MVIFTQNKQLLPTASPSLTIDSDTPVLADPLIIPDLRITDVCSLWVSFIIDDKAKCSITFNNTDYNLLQKDNIEKDVLFEKRIIYYQGDEVNFQFDKDVVISRMLFAFTLDSL